jgi:broad specificity phosphatase PhoE
MSKLVLVRHGQASFFSGDYDRLSETGERQARVLADYWLKNGVAFDEVYTGTLVRQRRTGEIAGEAFRAAGRAWPEHEVLPGLDEYPADDMMESLLPRLCEREERFRRLNEEFENAASGREKYRTFHRLLAAVMEEWIGGAHSANGLIPWTEFRDRVRAAFRRVLSREGNGRRVAVFSSGGVIGVSVQTVLEAPDRMAAELNWRVHNASITEFTFSGPRVALDCFNAVPHLADPELLTYR